MIKYLGVDGSHFIRFQDIASDEKRHDIFHIQALESRAETVQVIRLESAKIGKTLRAGQGHAEEILYEGNTWKEFDGCDKIEV